MSPLTHRLHDDLRLLVTTWTGPVTDADVVAAYRAAYADPGWVPGFNEVTDLRRADLRGVTADGLVAVANIVREALVGFKGTFRTAVLASTDVAFGLSRMYEMLSDESPESVRVFRDVVPAAKWVGIAPNVLERDPDASR